MSYWPEDFTAWAAISILCALLAGGDAIFGDSHRSGKTMPVESMMPGCREIARAEDRYPLLESRIAPVAAVTRAFVC
jgi:hypothetical protein